MCHCHAFIRPTTTTRAGNNIGDGGAKHLAKALEVNSSLHSLVLLRKCYCCTAWYGLAVREGEGRLCSRIWMWGEEGNYVKSRSTRALVEEEEPVIVNAGVT